VSDVAMQMKDFLFEFPNMNN